MRFHPVVQFAPLCFKALPQRKTMQLLSFDRTTSAQSAAVALLTIVAMAMLAVVAAYWTWQWLAPRPATPAAAAASEIRHATLAAGLFGTAQHEADSAAPVGIDIRLLGIVAATAGRNGYAVLRIEPREVVTVQEGKDIAPGIRLAEIKVDQVILERAGIRQTLSWPTKAASAESPVARVGK